MDRRAFLLLKTRGRERLTELSCERLYLRWADARFGAGRVEVGAAAQPGSQPWEGEPPAEILTESVDDVFAELERGLAAADVVRVVDRGWLADPRFRREIESRIEAFRARGGRVE